MRHRYRGILILGCLFAVTAFFSLRPGAASLVRSAFEPFFFVGNAPGYEAQFEKSERLAEAEGKVRRLEEENGALRRSQAIIGERETVRVLGEVLWYDPDPLRRAARIRIPRDASVQAGDIVVAPGDVLIGKIVSRSSRSADILLVDDPTFRMSVRIEEATGIAIGNRRGGFDIRFLPAKMAPEIGKAVETSGLEGKIPSGYPLGWVSGVTSSPTGSFTSVRAVSAANLYRLNWVFVIVSGDSTATP